jgi:hypothetical protein
VGPLLSPCLDPEVECIMQVDVRQERRSHSLNTKGNFSFDREIGLDRSRSVLDLRHKR